MSTVSTYTGRYFVTIGDLANRVCEKLENRTSLFVQACSWVKDSLVEITSNTDLRDDFDELEIWGNPFALTAGPPFIQEYSFSNLLPTVFDPVTNAVIDTVNMATLDVMIWTDPPTNSVRQQLGVTHYQDADRATTPQGGQPSEWYRFADTIGFNPPPDKAYQVQARILRYHPIDWAAIQITEILLNIDWHEIIVWGAVERGYMSLQEFDKAANIHTLIHGDPKYPMKVGLLQGAKKRR